MLEAKQCNPNQISIEDVPTPPGFMKECPNDAPYHHQLIGRLPLNVALEQYQYETPTNETIKIIEKLIEHGASREQPDCVGSAMSTDGTRRAGVLINKTPEIRRIF